MIIRMIIIHWRFDGGSAGEKHDIAHIASSIVARPMAGFFLLSAGYALPCPDNVFSGAATRHLASRLPERK
ncbi:hypothetical protein CKF43_06605 [Pantoea graminicola]|nr:hypothetical protein CKF43_06605 [Pantoea sp. ARC607]